jgi:hypothetical protein
MRKAEELGENHSLKGAFKPHEKKTRKIFESHLIITFPKRAAGLLTVTSMELCFSQCC